MRGYGKYYFCFFADYKRKVVCLALETSRGCKRYHIDNVPMRLLVTYYGRGTEWLPSDAADYDAYYSGKNNKKILINSAKKIFKEMGYCNI